MTLPTRLENHDAGQGRPCTGINQPAQAIIQPGRRAHEPALQWGERRERPACRSPLTSPLNWNGTQAVPYKILFDSQKIPRFRRNGGFPIKIVRTQYAERKLATGRAVSARLTARKTHQARICPRRLAAKNPPVPRNLKVYTKGRHTGSFPYVYL